MIATGAGGPSTNRRRGAGPGSAQAQLALPTATAAIVTDDYPTRYVAFANAGVWVIQRDTDAANKVGGHSFAEYHEPRTNVLYPYITNGIDVSIMRHNNSKPGAYMVDGYAERFDWGRAGIRECTRHGTWLEAKAAADAFIVRGRAHVAASVIPWPLCECCGECLRHSDGANPCGECAGNHTVGCAKCRARRGSK